MAKIEKFYIDEIAQVTKATLNHASKKHKSINAYCIFVEGDHFHILMPAYKNEAEEQKGVQKMISALVAAPEACKAFAKFVVPTARYFERKEKKNKQAIK